MKLVNILEDKATGKVSKSTFSENCTLAQAFTMIESWCNDNNCVYPSLCNIWKSKGIIIVAVKTNNDKFINEFNIID